MAIEIVHETREVLGVTVVNDAPLVLSQSNRPPMVVGKRVKIVRLSNEPGTYTVRALGKGATGHVRVSASATLSGWGLAPRSVATLAAKNPHPRTQL